MKFLRSKVSSPRFLIEALAIVIGIALAIYAYTSLNNKVAETNKTVQVPVLNKDVDAYAKITQNDVVMVEFPSLSLDNYVARTPEEIANKITIAPLYKDHPVDKRNLVEPGTDSGDYYVIGINVDPTRSAGVRPGDLVDVYRIPTTHGQDVINQLIASKVRVLKVCDEKGNPIDNPTTIQSAVAGAVVPKKGASIVYLAVRQSDVSKVIGGAAPKNAAIALAKRPNNESALIDERSLDIYETVPSLEGAEGAAAPVKPTP